MPGISRGFHFWQRQHLDRVRPPWLANPRPPAMSPHTNGTRHQSHWFISGKKRGSRYGGKRMIQRLNEEEWLQGNAVLSTWRWCKHGWPCLSHWLTPALLVVNCVKFYERLLHCLITQINKFMTCKHYLLYFSRRDVFEFPLRQQGMTLETHQVATPSLAPTRTHSDQLLRNGWPQSTLHTLIQQPLHHM